MKVFVVVQINDKDIVGVDVFRDKQTMHTFIDAMEEYRTDYKDWSCYWYEKEVQ